MDLSKLITPLDNGTRYSFSAFICSLGIIQTLFLKSIARELLKKGVEPTEVKDLFDKLDFFYAAKEFSEIQDQLTALEKSGVSLNEIFRQPKVGGSAEENIYAKGTDFETKV